MRKLHTHLPLALAACATLAGCGDTGKKPSLGSGNGRERLQAVRRIQEKYGAVKPAKTADEEAIVGRWNHPVTDTNYIVFNADGTYRWVALLGFQEGTYHLLPTGVIEFVFHNGKSRVEQQYRLIDDTLDLQVNVWIGYKRAQQ